MYFLAESAVMCCAMLSSISGVSGVTPSDVSQHASIAASQQALHTIIGLPHLEDAETTTGHVNPAYSCNTWPPAADQTTSVAVVPSRSLNPTDPPADQTTSVAIVPSRSVNPSDPPADQTTSVAVVPSRSVNPSDRPADSNETAVTFTL